LGKPAVDGAPTQTRIHYLITSTKSTTILIHIS